MEGFLLWPMTKDWRAAATGKPLEGMVYVALAELGEAAELKERAIGVHFLSGTLSPK